MLTTKEKGLLVNIIKHCKRIEKKIIGVSKDDFFQNDDILEIVCFNIFQIGELTKHFDLTFIKENNQVPWKEIKGMRDIIGHGYGSIEKEEVWKTASFEIKPLREYCETILSNDIL